MATDLVAELRRVAEVVECFDGCPCWNCRAIRLMHQAAAVVERQEGAVAKLRSFKTDDGCAFRAHDGHWIVYPEWARGPRAPGPDWASLHDTFVDAVAVLAQEPRP